MAGILNRVSSDLNLVQDVRLFMIVRDEGHCIERCLSSVRPYITSWCIVDTGSTDDTKEKVKKALDGIPGVLHERPWVDFGHNRTECIKLASEGYDGLLFTIDADEEVTHWPFFIPNYGDAGTAEGNLSGKTFERILVFNPKNDWKYEGRVHEWPSCGFNPRIVKTGIKFKSYQDGGRHSVPGWLENDISKCMDDFSETGNIRCVIHLAKMLRSNGYKKEAGKMFELIADKMMD